MDSSRSGTGCIVKGPQSTSTSIFGLFFSPNDSRASAHDSPSVPQRSSNHHQLKSNINIKRPLLILIRLLILLFHLRFAVLVHPPAGSAAVRNWRWSHVFVGDQLLGRWRPVSGRYRIRPETRLPQSRAGGQGPYLRSLDHLDRGSMVKE